MMPITNNITNITAKKMLHPLPPDDSIRRIISMQNEKILKIIFSIIENHFIMQIDK